MALVYIRSVCAKYKVPFGEQKNIHTIIHIISQFSQKQQQHCSNFRLYVDKKILLQFSFNDEFHHHEIVDAKCSYLKSFSPINCIVKRWSVAESFTIFENHVYRVKKNLMFAQKFEATPKLIQHLIAIGSIENLIKRWSVAESFTIFENHVYSH